MLSTHTERISIALRQYRDLNCNIRRVFQSHLDWLNRLVITLWPLMRGDVCHRHDVQQNANSLHWYGALRRNRQVGELIWPIA